MSPDPGLAPERTTLAWHRTGLSSVAVGAISLQVFWEAGAIGIALSLLLVGVGGVAYVAGAATPTTPGRLRAISLGVTVSAVLGAFLSIVG